MDDSMPTKGRSDARRLNGKNKECFNADLTGKVFTGADAAVGDDPAARIDMQVNSNAEATNPVLKNNIYKNNGKKILHIFLME